MWVFSDGFSTLKFDTTLKPPFSLNLQKTRFSTLKFDTTLKLVRKTI